MLLVYLPLWTLRVNLVWKKRTELGVRSPGFQPGHGLWSWAGLFSYGLLFSSIKLQRVNNMLSKIFFFFFLHWHAMFLSKREWWLGGGGGRGECRKKKRSHSSGGICLNWWWWKWWVQCEWVLNDKDCVYIKSCYCPSSKVYIAYNEHPLKMTM